MTAAGPHDHDSAFRSHDHAACMGRALDQAAESCAAQGLRLTPVRRRVLEILLEGHRALGAYDVLERLRAEGLGSQPPVAYRALDFLVDNGFAHRIHRLNAFIACVCPDQGHAPAFLICRKCRLVEEAAGIGVRGQLSRAAGDIGFAVERTMVEAIGLCPACQDAA